MLRIWWREVWRAVTRGLCRHRDLRRVKADGVWYFSCSCGYRVPVVRATACPRCRDSGWWVDLEGEPQPCDHGAPIVRGSL